MISIDKEIFRSYFLFNMCFNHWAHPVLWLWETSMETSWQKWFMYTNINISPQAEFLFFYTSTITLRLRMSLHCAWRWQSGMREYSLLPGIFAQSVQTHWDASLCWNLCCHILLGFIWLKLAQIVTTSSFVVQTWPSEQIHTVWFWSSNK